MSAEPLEHDEPFDAGTPDWQDDPVALANIADYLLNRRTLEESDGETNGEPPSRWTRIVLAAFIGLPAEVPTIAGLFYAARRHLISGPGEALKTWLCLAATVAEIKASRGVIWADIDGMGPRDITARLLALGATEEEIEQYVYFTNPEGQLDAPELRELLAWAAQTRCRLFVADAFTGFLVQHDLDGNVGKDVERAWNRLDPLLAAGIAVVLIDHVIKNPDNRNGQAIGSERKGTASYLHFDLKPLEKLARGGTGRSRVNVSRDRGAHFPRPTAGELILHSNADTGAVTWTLKPPTTDGDTFRPTIYMERVSRYIEQQIDAAKGDIEAGVAGGTDYIRLALDILIDEGFVSRTRAARGALLHASLKPYREAEDDLASTSPKPEAS